MLTKLLFHVCSTWAIRECLPPPAFCNGLPTQLQPSHSRCLCSSFSQVSLTVFTHTACAGYIRTSKACREKILYAVWGCVQLQHKIYYERCTPDIYREGVRKNLLCSLLVWGSLVPRPHPAFRCLQYGKAGEGLVSFLTWVMSGW